MSNHTLASAIAKACLSGNDVRPFTALPSKREFDSIRNEKLGRDETTVITVELSTKSWRTFNRAEGRPRSNNRLGCYREDEARIQIQQGGSVESLWLHREKERKLASEWSRRQPSRAEGLDCLGDVAFVQSLPQPDTASFTVSERLVCSSQ